MFLYLEVFSDTTKQVVKRMDVSGKSSRQIEVLESALFSRIDFNRYSTRVNKSLKELNIF